MRGSILQLSAIKSDQPQKSIPLSILHPFNLIFLCDNELLLYNVFCRLMQLEWKKKISNLWYNRQMSQDQRSV